MNNLRTLRKQHQLSMKALGNIVGVAESTISLYENEKREPDLSTLKKIADYFGVSVDYILGRDEMESIPVQPKKNTVISIGRGGERRVHELSDEDAAFVDAFLEKLSKKK